MVHADNKSQIIWNIENIIKFREKKIIIRKYRIKRLLFSLAIRNLKLLLKHEIKYFWVFEH